MVSLKTIVGFSALWRKTVISDFTVSSVSSTAMKLAPHSLLNNGGLFSFLFSNLSAASSLWIVKHFNVVGKHLFCL
jgi:hypothetical protein